MKSSSDTDRAEFALFVFLALLVALLLSQLLDYGYGRDQAIYSVVADVTLDGGAPYRDAWDFKPPGIHFLYALARGSFGRGAAAARILEALLLLSFIHACGIFSRRHLASYRAGAVGGSVGILATVPLGFWYTGQPEVFGAVALGWALVCATWQPEPSGEGSRRGLALFLAWSAAAALYSAAALLKPPLGGGILVSFVFVLIARRKAGEYDGWLQTIGPPTLAFAIGGSLPLIAIGIAFAALGATSELYQTLFEFTPNYVALGLGKQPFPFLFGRTLADWLLRAAPFNFVGILLLFSMKKLHRRERIGVAHVLGLIGFSLVGVALQAKFFLYHYAAVLPLTGLLAGWGYWKLWQRARASIPLALVSALVLMAVALDRVPGLPTLGGFWEHTGKRLRALGSPERREALRDRLYSLGDVDARQNRQAARWIADNTQEESRLYVWGFEPALYVLSGRRPASRYIYNVPQRASWSRAESRRILMEELRAHPPSAIVTVSGDPLPWVTGSQGDSHTALRGFPALRMLIDEEYAPAQQFGDLHVWLRVES